MPKAKSETVVIPEIAKGYYKLTKDVTNPHPDRRSDRYNSRVLWKKATIVKVQGPGGGSVGIITFPDNSYVMFGGGGTGKSNSQQRAGDEIARNIEPAPDTLGLVLKDAGPGADDVLAHLIETGKITLDDVKAALVGIDALDARGEYDPHAIQADVGYNNLRRRHGLTVYGASDDE
jgi:hypothetical protein